MTIKTTKNNKKAGHFHQPAVNLLYFIIKMFSPDGKCGRKTTERTEKMFEVTIIKSFSAAHLLAEIGGKCEELHGHNFKVEVTVGAPALNSEGILIDFRLVKKWLKDVLDRMDHQHLNDLSFFAGINPSSENISLYIYQEMQTMVKETAVKILRVKVWESENAAVSYLDEKGDGLETRGDRGKKI